MLVSPCYRTTKTYQHNSHDEDTYTAIQKYPEAETSSADTSRPFSLKVKVKWDDIPGQQLPYARSSGIDVRRKTDKRAGKEVDAGKELLCFSIISMCHSSEHFIEQ